MKKKSLQPIETPLNLSFHFKKSVRFHVFILCRKTTEANETGNTHANGQTGNAKKKDNEFTRINKSANQSKNSTSTHNKWIIRSQWITSKYFMFSLTFSSVPSWCRRRYQQRRQTSHFHCSINSVVTEKNSSFAASAYLQESVFSKLAVGFD